MFKKPIYPQAGHFIIRIVFGLLFCYHGFDKILNYSTYSPHFPDPLGFGQEASYLLVIFAEFAGGLAVAAGFLTRFFISTIFITMSVAFFAVHAQDPFPSKELPFLFWILSISLFFTGPGKFSLDNYMVNKLRQNKSLLQSAAK